MCLDESVSILENGSIKWLTVSNLIAINRKLIISSEMPNEPFAVIDSGALQSSCSSPAQYRYYQQTEDMFELASVLMYSLIKNHCFANANKRTAMEAGSEFLLMNGYELPTIDSHEVVEIIEGVAINKYSREELENWLYSHHVLFDTRKLCED